jgi:pimeloyl-ACP methyl ester carboxylesterase
MSVVRLSYVQIGSGAPLVLIMGLGASAAAWQPHYDAWSATRRCIAVDNRGAGASSLGTQPASTRNMAQDVAELMDHLQLGNCDVVGISMGSCIAQELAIARPDLVRSMVLVAPWARTDPVTKSQLQLVGRLRQLGDAELFNEFLRNLVWTPEWINEHLEEMTSSLSAAFQMSNEAFAQQVAACVTHDTLSRLGALRLPVLVTVGDADRFIQPTLSHEVANTITGASRLAFPGLGHVHHWEDLERFNRTVMDWLS